MAASVENKDPARIPGTPQHREMQNMAAQDEGSRRAAMDMLIEDAKSGNTNRNNKTRRMALQSPTDGKRAPIGAPAGKAAAIASSNASSNTGGSRAPSIELAAADLRTLAGKHGSGGHKDNKDIGSSGIGKDGLTDVI